MTKVYCVRTSCVCNYGKKCESPEVDLIRTSGGDLFCKQYKRKEELLGVLGSFTQTG